MKTKLITLLCIGIALIGTMGLVSANGYGDYTHGTLTLGFHTPAVYDLETWTMTPGFYTPMVYAPDVAGDEMEATFYESIIPGTLTLGFNTAGTYDPETGACTPGFYTPMVYTPEGKTAPTDTVGVTPPEQNAPEQWVTPPGEEVRGVDEPGVPEAYSLREDLAGTDMPGAYIGRCFVP
jgi:hypothetical protein